MSNIRVLEQKTDVRETLLAAMDGADDMEGIMIIALHRDGTQHLWASTMSQMQKSFLVSFVNAWLMKWFRLGEV